MFQGEGLHRELELLVAAGLTPVQAIQAATGNAAKFMQGETADWGSIAVGKRADPAVVSGRPDMRTGATPPLPSVMPAGRPPPGGRGRWAVRMPITALGLCR